MIPVDNSVATTGARSSEAYNEPPNKCHKIWERKERADLELFLCSCVHTWSSFPLEVTANVIPNSRLLLLLTTLAATTPLNISGYDAASHA